MSDDVSVHKPFKEMGDTQLLVKGERYSFRCVCGGNVFRSLGLDLFQCNGCRERYKSE